MDQNMTLEKRIAAELYSYQGKMSVFVDDLHGHTVEIGADEEFEYQPQRLMNAMNEAAPKVIFSRMTYPLDLELMHSGRKFLNAELWVALPETKLKEKVRTTFWRKVRKKIFQKKVNEYNLEKAEQ